jgi:hypothetical protein
MDAMVWPYQYLANCTHTYARKNGKNGIVLSTPTRTLINIC